MGYLALVNLLEQMIFGKHISSALFAYIYRKVSAVGQKSSGLLKEVYKNVAVLFEIC